MPYADLSTIVRGGGDNAGIVYHFQINPPRNVLDLGNIFIAEYDRLSLETGYERVVKGKRTMISESVCSGLDFPRRFKSIVKRGSNIQLKAVVAV